MSVIEAHRFNGVKWKRFARRVGYATALLPASVGAIGAVAVGRPDTARRWWARISETEASSRQPSAPRLLAHALLSIPLGLLSLIPIGIEILFVLRGILYPLVDHGPYTHSWGGPSVGGAWLAHFAISLPFAAAGLGALWILGQWHSRLTGGTWGHKVGLVPVLALVPVLGAAAMLVIAWTHQL